MNFNVIDIIECVCSVLSLIISIFAVSSVVKIKKDVYKNKIIQKGKNNINNSGTATILTDESTLNQYISDKVIPNINKDFYEFDITDVENNIACYNEVCKDVLKYSFINDTLNMDIDFTTINYVPTKIQFASYCIRTLPMTDWRGFIKENYVLEFDCISDFDGIMQVEIGAPAKKLYQFPLKFFSNTRINHRIYLGKYLSVIDKWDDVNEICFVFFVDNCLNSKGFVNVENMSIHKL